MFTLVNIVFEITNFKLINRFTNVFGNESGVPLCPIYIFPEMTLNQTLINLR